MTPSIYLLNLKSEWTGPVGTKAVGGGISPKKIIIRRRPRERDFDDARLSVSRFTRIAIGSLGPRGIALPKDGRWLAMTDARCVCGEQY